MSRFAQLTHIADGVLCVIPAFLQISSDGFPGASSGMDGVILRSHSA